MCSGHAKAPCGSGGGYTAQEVLLCYSLAYTKLTMANMPVVLEPMICTGKCCHSGLSTRQATYSGTSVCNSSGEVHWELPHVNVQMTVK